MNRQSRQSPERSQMEDLTSWDCQRAGQDSYKSNIFAFLSQNINNYKIAYIKEKGLTKNITSKQKSRKNMSLVRSNLNSSTSNVSSKCTKNPIHQQIKQIRRRIMSQASENPLIQLQNQNINLHTGSNYNRKHKILKNIHNYGINIHNMEFNKVGGGGYMKKKEKYKEIFGEKPKFVMVKADEAGIGYKGIVTNSAMILKPR